MGRAVETLRLVGINARAFAAVLAFGMAVGAGAFVWTIEQAPAIRRSSGTGPTGLDPDPAFGAKIRQMYALGGDEAVINACADRRSTMPRDPEGWLFAALSLERIAAQPGLPSIHARAEADLLWNELLAWARDTTRPMRGRAYFEGWALAHLGQPLRATQRWTDHAHGHDEFAIGLGNYNAACYLALAGDTDQAQVAWRLAATQETLDLIWAPEDPDLESIAGTFEFELWYHWQRMRRMSLRDWRWGGPDRPRSSDRGRPRMLRRDF
jgi:hypothetical protein